MIKLRQYQREAIDSLFEYWGNGGGNGLIVLPTGSGKSAVIATICQELLHHFPDMRIGIVAHIKELIQQNASELIRVWQQAPVGIYSAGVGRRDTRSQILFMGIQSVHKKAFQLGGFDLLLIDECHLVGRSTNSMYGKFITDCKTLVPDMRICGTSATPYRLDSGRLDKGADRLFDEVVYDANVCDLIQDGFLSPLISKATLSKINTDGLHVRSGEFIQSEIDERARIPTVVESAVNEIVDLGQDRDGWLVFCTGVDHAAQVRDEIRKHGISCEIVTGETPHGERDSIIRRYKDRHIRCLVTINVLSVGFNAPHVSLIALLRPTLSCGLYVQQVGRGLRTAPGKQNCLVLDFAGVIQTHGPVDAVKPKRGQKAGSSKQEDVEPSYKVCPQCRSYIQSRLRECPECNYVYPHDPAKHEARADEDAPILSNEKTQSKFKQITKTIYTRHAKTGGGTDSMRAEYFYGFTCASEWVCFEHTGYTKNKAVMWWKQRGGKMPAPKTIAEGIARAPHELRIVTGVLIHMNGKYPQVVSVEMGDYPEDRDSYVYEPPNASYEAERGKKIDHVRALRLKTVANGCTPSEAESALAMARKIQREYRITDEQVGRSYYTMDEDIPF